MGQQLSEKITTRFTLQELRLIEDFAKQNKLTNSQAQRELTKIALNTQKQHTVSNKLQLSMLVEILMIVRESLNNDEDKFNDIQQRAQAFLQDSL